MNGENPLNAYAEGYLPHREALAHAGAALAYNCPLERLDAFIGAFYDLEKDLDLVPGRNAVISFFFWGASTSSISDMLISCYFIFLFNRSGRFFFVLSRDCSCLHRSISA